MITGEEITKEEVERAIIEMHYEDEDLEEIETKKTTSIESNYENDDLH